MEILRINKDGRGNEDPEMKGDGYRNMETNIYIKKA